MLRQFFLVFALGLGLLGTNAASALTIEEATALSQQTGRPIFAVAGTET